MDQKVSEKMVVSIPDPFAVERHKKKVLFSQVVYELTAVVTPGLIRQQGVAQGGAETVQHRGYGKKVKDFGWLMGDHFIHQILGDQAVAAREPLDEFFGVFGLRQGQPRQLQADHPSFNPFLKYPDGFSRQTIFLEEYPYFLFGKGKVGGS